MKILKRRKRILPIILAIMLTVGAVCQQVPAEAATKAVRLSKTRISLQIGKSKTLKIKKKRGVKIKKKTFRSSNKKVATVTSKGKIKAKKAGKAIIKVTVKYIKGGKKKTSTLKCKVTVKKKSTSSKTTKTASTRTPAVSGKPIKNTASPAPGDTVDSNKVTRLTWIKELVKKLGLQTLTKSDMTKFVSKPIYSFDDITNTSDALIVEAAVQHGLITDEEVMAWQSKFQPNAVIEQEYAIVTALRGLGYTGELVDVTCDALKKNADYPEYDQIAIECGLLETKEDGTVNVHQELLIPDKDRLLEKVGSLQRRLSEELENKDNSIYSDKYHDGAIDSDAQYTIEESGDQFIITVSSDFVNGLEADQSFYLPASDSCPDGAMLVAKEIQVTGENTIITAVLPESLDDVYERVDMQGCTDVTEEDFEPAENVTVQQKSTAKKSAKQLKKKSVEGSVELDLGIEDKDLGTIHLGLENPQINYLVDIARGSKINQILITLSQTTTLTCDFKGETEESIPLGTIKKKIGGGTLEVLINISAVFSLEGEVTINAMVTMEAGINYQKSSGIQNCHDFEYTHDMEAKVDAKAGLDLQLKLVAFEFEIAGHEIIRGKDIIDMGVEGGVEASADVQSHVLQQIENGESETKSLLCMDFQLNPYLSLYVGKDETTLFRKWLDAGPYSRVIMDKDCAPSYLIMARHVEKVDDQPMETVDFCTYKSNGEGDGWKLQDGVLTVTKVTAKLSEDPVIGWKELREFVKYIIVDADVVVVDEDGQVDNNKKKTCSLYELFAGMPHVKKVKIKRLDLSRVHGLQSLFKDDKELESVKFGCTFGDTITDTSYMFSGCEELRRVNTKDWDTGNVTDMSYMFENCESLNRLEIEGWDTGSLENMSGLCYYCTGLQSINLGQWRVKKDTKIDESFRGCVKIPSFQFAESWESSGEDMDSCFGDTGIFDWDLRDDEENGLYTCLTWLKPAPQALKDYLIEFYNPMCVEP